MQNLMKFLSKEEFEKIYPHVPVPFREPDSIEHLDNGMTKRTWHYKDKREIIVEVKKDTNNGRD